MGLKSSCLALLTCLNEKLANSLMLVLIMLYNVYFFNEILHIQIKTN